MYSVQWAVGIKYTVTVSIRTYMNKYKNYNTTNIIQTFVFHSFVFRLID